MRLLRSNNVQRSILVLNDLQFVNIRRVKDQQFLRKGDVVICMANGSRALVGKAASFRETEGMVQYTFGAFMGAFRPGAGVDPTFASLLFQTNDFRKWIGLILAGSSINNLRPSNVEAFHTTIPTLDEQSAIANVLADADEEIELLKKRLEKAKLIKQGMMQELLTGRTRLPVSEREAS